MDTKTGDFDPSSFDDHYEVALVDLLKKKQAGVPIRVETAKARPANVVNLMDALRKSLVADKAAVKAAPKKTKKRVPGQTEMLLPITGSAKEKTAKKSQARPAARQRRAG